VSSVKSRTAECQTTDVGVSAAAASWGPVGRLVVFVSCLAESLFYRRDCNTSASATHSRRHIAVAVRSFRSRNVFTFLIFCSSSTQRKTSASQSTVVVVVVAAATAAAAATRTLDDISACLCHSVCVCLCVSQLYVCVCVCQFSCVLCCNNNNENNNNSYHISNVVFKNINCVFFAKKAIKNNFLKHLARPRPSKPDKSQRQNSSNSNSNNNAKVTTTTTTNNKNNNKKKYYFGLVRTQANSFRAASDKNRNQRQGTNTFTHVLCAHMKIVCERT